MVIDIPPVISIDYKVKQRLAGTHQCHFAVFVGTWCISSAAPFKLSLKLLDQAVCLERVKTCTERQKEILFLYKSAFKHFINKAKISPGVFYSFQ